MSELTDLALAVVAEWEEHKRLSAENKRLRDAKEAKLKAKLKKAGKR